MLLANPSRGQEPPANLAKLVAHRETETETERNEYTYRQSVTLDELDDHGGARGQFRETRDIIFSPQHDRTEQMVGSGSNGLKNLILTEEDFEDIRNIQPLVLTEDRLWNYETKFKGEETMDEVDCWVLQVRPRQILQGQRFFDGMIWVDKKGYNIVRMEGHGGAADPDHQGGKPVPAVHDDPQTAGREALVPGLYVRRRYATFSHRRAENPAENCV